MRRTHARRHAHAHGYDFAFVRTFASSAPPGANREERDAACFHPAFALWRVSCSQTHSGQCDRAANWGCTVRPAVGVLPVRADPFGSF
jgi:hypothetical protein